MTEGEKGLMMHLTRRISVFQSYNMHKHGMDVMITVTLTFNLTILM